MKRFLLPAFLLAALLGGPVTSQAADGPGRKKARPAKALQKKAVEAPKSTSAANWGSSADDDALWATPAREPAVATTAAATAPVPNDDPAMRSSGVMLAPGMNTAPYRGVSTDYNGRPLNKPAQKVVAAAPADDTVVEDDPMMRSSGVMLAPGMNTAPYRGVSTDYHGRPLKKKAKKALAAHVATEAPVATAELPQW
ncbi:hypothetical protein GCM10022408_06590 [Hymenobacter fastidiosus]|uniref:Uncharacterized protein n=1 Tax=Hymenobacter fastidiosus TaxID=486264 RepID=A0ABP7RJH4_9BACT